MGRPRRLFTGNQSIGGKTSKSRRVARQITSSYHNIRNEIDELKGQPSSKENKSRIIQLEAELQSLGGISKYQQASIVTTSHFKTSKYFIQTLEALHKKPAEPGIKLKTLEVGAINIQLSQCPWLDVLAIDVHSQHPRIQEVDFFTLEPNYDYDVVICSMVINCVPRADLRGEMIARLACSIRPATGILFIALPIRCVQSPFVGEECFLEFMQCFGLTLLLPIKTTPKLVFYALQSNLQQEAMSWRGEVRNCCRRADETLKRHFAKEPAGAEEEGMSASASFYMHFPQL